MFFLEIKFIYNASSYNNGPPKDVYVLIPGICECYLTRGIKVVDGIKIPNKMTLR